MEIISLERVFKSAVQFPSHGRWKVDSYPVRKAWGFNKTTWSIFQVYPGFGETETGAWVLLENLKVSKRLAGTSFHDRVKRKGYRWEKLIPTGSGGRGGVSHELQWTAQQADRWEHPDGPIVPDRVRQPQQDVCVTERGAEGRLRPAGGGFGAGQRSAHGSSLATGGGGVKNP